VSGSTSARVARNTAIQAGGEIVSKVASLAFFVVMARLLEPEGFGAFTFALSLAMLLTVLSDLGTDTILTREVARERTSIHQLFWNSIALRAGAGVLSLAIAFAIVVVGDYSSETQAAVGLLVVAVLVELFAKTLYGSFRAYEDMAPIASAIMLQRIFTAAVGIAVMAIGGEVVAASLVYLVGALLGLAYAARALLRRHGGPRFEVSYVTAKELALVALPIGIAGIFYTMLLRVNATMLSLMEGEVAVGIYGVSARLLESTMFISFAFVSSIVPTLSRLTRDTTPTVSSAYEKAAKALAAALFPLGTLFALFAQPIVDLLYGSDYGDSATVLRLLGGATALYGLSYLASYVLVSQDRQRVIPWAIGAIVVQNVVLNLVLIPRWSYDGAALATTISELTVAIVLTTFAVRATGPISPLRILAGPVAGSLAMCGVALALGMGWAGLLVAVPAYAAGLLLVERALFPADLEVIASMLRRRRRGEPLTEVGSLD
jgi:O-antigen/teichoic acid export membrane protein